MIFAIDLFSFYIKRTGWARFVSTFFLFYAQIIVTEFLLGSLSILTPLWIVCLNLCISLLIIFFVYKNAGTKVFSRYTNTIKASIGRLYRDVKTDRHWRWLLIVASLLLGWIILLGVLFPATDFDGNSYHLTFIGYAIQNHNFFDVPTSIGWLTGYPKGGEFIQMWNVIVTRNDVLVDLVQIPFLALGVYALYVISRKLGVAKKEARFVSLLYLFLPIVLNQLKTTYIDVMLCALFFAAIAMVVKTRLGKLDLLIVGIIFSLLISIKFTGFLFVAGLLPLLLWNLYSHRHKGRKSLLKSYIYPLLIVFPPTLFGLYWYIKNFILYGNPLYPFGLKVGGITIFPGKTFQDLAAGAVSTLKGFPEGCVERVWFVWTEQKDWYGCLYNYDANFTGLGPIWFIILIPAIVVSLYFVFKKRNYLYIGIITIVMSIFALYPLNYYSRYTMFITALGVISLGIVFTNTRKALTDRVKTLTIILAVSVFFMNFALCNFPPSIVVSQLHSVRAGDPRGLAYENVLGSSYVFMQRTLQRGDTVAYDSRPYYIYALWKPDFSNRVIYLPAKDKASWVYDLKANNVKYVFTNVRSKEHRWAKDDGSFRSIYKDVQYEIYQVR